MRYKNTLFVSLVHSLVDGGVEDDHNDEDEGGNIDGDLRLRC